MGEGVSAASFTGAGRAKLLLFGEHAAVHGFPAVGVALPWSLEVRIECSEARSWALDGVAAEDAGRLRSVLGTLETLLPFPERRTAGRIEVCSAIPRSLGFGSSAALCVALARCVTAMLGGDETVSGEDELWNLSHEAERLFHGTPSGIDTGLSLFGGLQAFYPEPPRIPRRRALGGGSLCLVVGSVPRSDDTRSLVLGLGEKVRRGEPGVRERLARLGSIAERAIALLDGGHECGAESLGDLADAAQESLAALKLSAPLLERVLESGRVAGATGGKLSGAGGGGAFFLVVRDEDGARRVADAVRETLRTTNRASAETVKPARLSGATIRFL